MTHSISDDLTDSIQKNNFNVKFRLFELNEKLSSPASSSASTGELSGQLEVVRHSLTISDKKLKKLGNILEAPEVKPFDKVEEDYRQSMSQLRTVIGIDGEGDGLKVAVSTQHMSGDDLSLQKSIGSYSVSTSIHSLFDGISPIKSPKKSGAGVEIEKVEVGGDINFDTGTANSDSAPFSSNPISGGTRVTNFPRISQFAKPLAHPSKDVNIPPTNNDDRPPVTSINNRLARLDLDEDPFSSDSERIESTLPLQQIQPRVSHFKDNTSNYSEDDLQSTKKSNSPRPSVKVILAELYSNLETLSKEQISQKLQNCIFLLDDIHQVEPQHYQQSPIQPSNNTDNSTTIKQLRDQLDLITRRSESLQRQLFQLQNENPNNDITAIQELYVRRYDAERLRNARADLRFMISFQARQLDMYKKASRKRLQILQASGAIEIHDTTILQDGDDFEDITRHHRPTFLAAALTIISAIRLRNRLDGSRSKLHSLRLKVKEAAFQSQ